MRVHLPSDWWQRPHRDLLAGLVVAFALIPEAIAFSGIAGVDPQVGLFGAFSIAITAAFVGGWIAMISAATGSTALLMTSLVQRGEALGAGLGLQYLLAAGILTGLLQILWGYLRLAHQMRFVPQPVLAGFVNSLAVLIALAQLPQLGLNLFHPETVTVRPDQLPAVWGLLALTLAIIYGLPRVTRAVPSALVAIVVGTGLAIGLDLDVPGVASLGRLPTGQPTPGLPQVPFDLNTLGFLLPTALAISLVGLMETFLTQDLLDDLTDSDSNRNREARGQGIANLVSSFLGGMAGCALVGQSVMNVNNGGRTRLSTFTAGASLLLMILLASHWVNRIPMAVLAGVALAAILFSRKVAKVITVERIEPAHEHCLYRVRGQLFFVSVVYFKAGFALHEHPARVTIDMGEAHLWDQSGVVALDQVIRKLRSGGSQVEVVGLNPESVDLFARLGVAPEAGGRGGVVSAGH
ncbi:MAG: SulP family inorganic anion transporter [Synechococcus sp.]